MLKGFFRALKRWARREDGAVAIDFVAVVGPALIFFILTLELAMSYHFGQTLEKAGQMGVRYAVVEPPAATDIPEINEIADGKEAGVDCADPSDPCMTPTPSVWVCDRGGAGCDTAVFASLLSEIRRLAPMVGSENVVVTYAYAELGVSGGQMTPTVTIDILGVENPLSFLSVIRSGLMDQADFTTAPAVRAFGVAEDMSGNAN